MLQNITKCYRVLQSVTECYRVVQSTTECYRLLQSIFSASTWTNFWACSFKFTLIINIQEYKMRFKTSIFHQRIIRSIQLGMKWMLQLKVSFSVSSHILLTWVFFSADLVKYEMKAKKMSEMVGLHLKGNPRYILFGWSHP